MPNGRVKVFHENLNYGFVVTDDGRDVFVSGEDVDGSRLGSGDEVEFELGENDSGRKQAKTVKVTRTAPPDNPIGRTMTNPPSWDQLEDLERQRRQNRRRRR